MALTSSQRAAVRLYVGWPAFYRQADPGLEGAMDLLSNDADHEAQVIALITDLTTIDTDLKNSHGRLKADKVGSIELNRSEISQRRSEGRRLVGRLCSLLGIKRGVDVFSSGSSNADNYVGK